MNYNYHLVLLFLTRAEGSQKTGTLDLANYTHTLCKAPPAPAFHCWLSRERNISTRDPPGGAWQTSPGVLLTSNQCLPGLGDGTFDGGGVKP